MTSSTNSNEHALSHDDDSAKKKKSSPNMNKRAKKVKKPTSKPATTSSGTTTTTTTVSTTSSSPSNSGNSKSTKCQVCNSSAETNKNFMLTCKTCGMKIHLNCYDNDHLSKKFAKNWECVECKSCEVCKKSTYAADNQILICNRCDRGYHQNCCTGKFRTIPTGDKPWFCEECWTYLSEKKKKKKRKTEEPAQQEPPQQSEEGSLFELKPIEEQQQDVTKVPTLIATNDSAMHNGTSHHQSPSTTTPTLEVATAAIIQPETTAPNVASLRSTILESKINVFVVYIFGDKEIYSSQMMIDNISQSDLHRSPINYFQNLKHLLIERLRLKLEEVLMDEDCDDEIKALFLVQKFGIKRLAIKERDRFGSEIRVEIDRWYFEQYKLKDGDTIFVELTLKSAQASSSTQDEENGTTTDE